MNDFCFSTFDRKNIDDFFVKFPHRFANIIQCTDVSGDGLLNCSDSYQIFDCTTTESSKYCYGLVDVAKSCCDVDYFGVNLELAYESQAAGGNAFQLAFCHDCYDAVSDLIYCSYCHNSSKCFGCVGLKGHKNFCILNKQYSKEEYEALVPKIIEHMRQTGEWGEFFPALLSPFEYNISEAQEIFPMTKADVLAKGWKWRDEKTEVTNVTRTIPANRLPDSIDDIPDDILNWAIECEATKKPFKIQKAELDFYRKMRLPIPHYHPDVRHAHRMAKRNPQRLWTRKCDNCGITIHTSYAPDRPETVFCESCYQKAVY